MYRCLECGHLFEDGEEAVVREDRGEFCGFPCFEELSVCPICHGVYAETVRCQVCDSEHLDEELVDGVVCKNCLQEKSTDLDVCYKIGKHLEESVKLNGFLASVYDAKEIEEILLEYTRQAIKTDIILKQKFIEFMEYDEGWFAGTLLEVLKDEK